MLRDCFRCENRVQGSSCQYMESCMLGGVDHFKPRAKAKNRFDAIRGMSDDELTKFLLSFRPDVVKRIPNAESLLSSWLSEEARGKDFMNCWFFKAPDEPTVANKTDATSDSKDNGSKKEDVVEEQDAVEKDSKEA